MFLGLLSLVSSVIWKTEQPGALPSLGWFPVFCWINKQGFVSSLFRDPIEIQSSRQHKWWVVGKQTENKCINTSLFAKVTTLNKPTVLMLLSPIRLWLCYLLYLLGDGQAGSVRYWETGKWLEWPTGRECFLGGSVASEAHVSIHMFILQIWTQIPGMTFLQKPQVSILNMATH